MMLASISTIFISALAVSATPKLSLTVGGIEKEGGGDLKVSATLKNTGDETLRLLNDPRGILSKVPTNTFTISGVNGTGPAFNGVKVKYAPKYIVAKGTPSLFTVLQPGESIKVDHDLFDAYNFASGGAGSYKVNARNLFLYVDPATNASTRIYADVGTAHKLRVSSKKLKLAKAKRVTRKSKFAKRARFRKCSDKQIQQIIPATDAAKKFAQETLDYLKVNKQATDRYTTWFGKFTDARHNKVTQQYTNLASNSYSGFNYDCSCDEEGTFAFVYPDEFGVVNLCPAFWEAPLTGTDSKAGTIVHESSHFTANAGTDDHAYGQEKCQQLAKEDPDTAIMNADSHEYFSENTPAETKSQSPSSSKTPAKSKVTKRINSRIVH